MGGGVLSIPPCTSVGLDIAIGPMASTRRSTRGHGFLVVSLRCESRRPPPGGAGAGGPARCPLMPSVGLVLGIGPMASTRRSNPCPRCVPRLRVPTPTSRCRRWGSGNAPPCRVSALSWASSPRQAPDAQQGDPGLLVPRLCTVSLPTPPVDSGPPAGDRQAPIPCIGPVTGFLPTASTRCSTRRPQPSSVALSVARSSPSRRPRMT